MNRLSDRFKWLSLDEAARRVSERVGLSVTSADLLRLALDDQLQLAVQFSTPQLARPSREVFAEQASASDRLFRRHDRVFAVKAKNVTLLDVWNLPLRLEGDERRVVALQHHLRSTGRVPPDTRTVTVEDGFCVEVEGEFYQLCEFLEGSDVPAGYPVESDGRFYLPAGSLPDDGILGVRTAALAALEAAMMSERERAPTVVAAKVAGTADSHLPPPVGEQTVSIPAGTSSSESAQAGPTAVADGTVGGPLLAAWLKAEMDRHSLTKNRVHVLTNLDRKTVAKMLAGDRVHSMCREKLASGLNVPVLTVPTN